MSSETAEVSTSSDSVTRASWIFPEWLDIRRTTMKEIMSDDQEETRSDRCAALFSSYYDEDLEYCAFPEFKRDETDSEKEISKNFFENFLRTLRHVPEKSKKSVPYLSKLLCDTYVNWVEEKGIEETLKQKYLSTEVQDHAMIVASKRPVLIDSLERIFDIPLDSQIQRAKVKIEELHKAEKHKDSVSIAIKYGIVDDYSFEQLVIPVILSDKTQLVMDILVASTKMQKAYIQFLDGFIHKSEASVEEFFAPYKSITKIALDRFKGKNANSAIHRFFNGPVKQFKFNLTEKDAPNYDLDGKRRALRFYASQRFEDRKMTDEVYLQNVQALLTVNGLELFTAFLDDLWFQSDLRADAIAWMIFYDVNEFSNCVPRAIQKFFEFPNNAIVNAAYKIVESRKNCGTVKDGEEVFAYEEEKKYPIKVVKSAEQLEELCSFLKELNEGKDNPVLIGYDSEMKLVHFMSKSTTTLALIQLCIHETVYIVDLVELEKLENIAELLNKLVDNLFFADNIQVIGFGMLNDMDHLFATKFVTSKLEDSTSMFCLKQMVETITELDEHILKLGKSTCKLYEITEKLLGRTLDKGEQHSNWEVRPLRKKQLVYAAMDAVVVVELFPKILELVKGKGIGKEMLMKESNLMNRKEGRIEKKKDGMKKAEKMSFLEIIEAVKTHKDPSKPLQRPSDLRVIIDLNLHGLAYYLIRMSVDVCHPKNNAELADALKENKRAKGAEQRFFVVGMNKHTEQRLAEHGDKLILLNVPWGSTIEYFCKFLENFNLDVRPEDELEGLSSKSNESVLSN